MKILIMSVGKKHDPSLSESISDFTERINHYAEVEWKLVPDDAGILRSLGERDYVVLLDEKGKDLTSEGLAHFLQKRLNEGTHRLTFIIGGAYGMGEEVKMRANAAISISKLTFPHMLVRLILSEQIYRAFSILNGGKYHHE